MRTLQELTNPAYVVRQTNPRTGATLYASVSNVGGVDVCSWTADIEQATNYVTPFLAQAGARERIHAGYHLDGWLVEIEDVGL